MVSYYFFVNKTNYQTKYGLHLLMIFEARRVCFDQFQKKLASLSSEIGGSFSSLALTTFAVGLLTHFRCHK
jgi:hypothetical protein